MIEVTWLTILLLIPLLYVVIAVFETQRAAFGVTEAARAAGRAYVTAPDESTASQLARAAARLAIEDQGADAGRLRLSITCEPRPHNCLSTGSTVEVEVAYDVRLPLMPSALGGHTPAITLSAEHRAPYGTYLEDR